MLKNNFFTVGMFQLKLDLASNYEREYLLENEEYHKQMKNALEIIKKGNSDILIFPEMSYSKEYAREIIKLSENRVIIFGSTYEDGYNKTKVFNDKKELSIIKRYPSGAEPMSRRYTGLDPREFISKYLKEHTINFRGINVYILNCLEYYQAAYYIARDDLLNNTPFVFCCTCSNSNTKVFLDETKAIHNHNEYAYTFMCNTVSIYNGEKYGDGKSYIYGPIQAHEKDWLTQEGNVSDKSSSSILTLNSKDATYCEGTYFVSNTLSRFGRSDFYLTTPQNIKKINLL